MMIDNTNRLASEINDQPEITITQNDQCILQNEVIDETNIC
jgi:hypothetical protein